ncbi:protein kinase domain-containing protein [Streptomyces kurssanovii]|uniref:non-specific serine/threonine protein kinase n=1 Tax=Streptomyces kurssanovii TaxID=67312 RepID=A0ABV3HLH7_9ACTN
MSEAEQSRKPQRGAGFAGEDADSAVGAGAGSADGGEDSAAGAVDPKTSEADAAPEVDDAVPEVKDAVPQDKSQDGDVTPVAADPGVSGAVQADEDDAAAGGASAEVADARKPGHGTGSTAVTAAQEDARKDAQGDAREDASADTKPASVEDAKPLSVTKAGTTKAGTRPAEPADAPAVKAPAGGVNAGRSAGSPADGDRSAGSQAAAATSAPADRTGRAGDAGAAVSKGRGATGSEGRLLAGRYRLGGVLGRGGMGTVWRAVDETLGRTVAVKELRFPGSVDDDEKRRLITRTLREAKAIARIRNNSAVTVYDVVDEDDRPWIVMELVEGKSLAEVVREDGVLTPRRAAEVGLAILDVLRSAHREGILHRDVKPSNVLIGRDGRVVLTDFGIAQVEGDPSITSTGMLVGAPSYISPERARGHKPGPAADLWSLGGLLYASVEGCPPYDKGSAIATLTAVMTEPLDPPKNAGPLEEVIYGLLAKDPAQRLDDAGARALLTQVVNAPEAPVLPPEPEPSPEATRAIRLPSVPPVPPARPKDPAADRVRGALRSVRNAAAAVKAEPKQQPAPGGPARRAAAVRAPLTDVVPRRTLVIIAAVALIAVLSTVLVFAFSDDDPGNRTKGKDETAASAGSTAGGGEDKASGGAGADPSPDSGDDPGKDDGKEEDGGQGGSTGSPDGPPSGDPKDDDSAGGDTLPAGYVMVSNDRWHFTMAMPANFKLTGVAGQNSGGKFSVDGGVPRVQVDFNDSPKDDAAAAWAAAVAGVSATSNGYKHLGIGTVEYNGYPTVADWQFERNENGQRVRILNRGFKVDARRGYSIMITCKASEWRSKECETLRKTAFATFSPKD